MGETHWPTRGTYEEFMDDSLHKATVEESMVFDVATNWLRTRKKLATREGGDVASSHIIRRQVHPNMTQYGGRSTRPAISRRR